MATTAEQVETALAQMGGELRTEMASLTGSVDNLATEVRMDREARARSDVAHDQVHVDQEHRIRALEARKTVAPMTLWTVALGAVGAIAAIGTLVVNALT